VIDLTQETPDNLRLRRIHLLPTRALLLLQLYIRLKMPNISDNVKKNIVKLEFIGSIKNKQLRKKLFEYIASQPQMYAAMREIAYNIMQNRIDLPKPIKTKLKANKRSLLQLIRAAPKTRRKQLAVQTGGSLSLVFPLVMTLLSALR